MQTIALPAYCLLALILVSTLPLSAADLLIRNGTVWKDDRGQEILCQSGNLARFNGNYYFYGWADHPGDNRNDTLTCYSSADLVNWKFERDIFTRTQEDREHIIPNRLEVLYNANTKKYVLIAKNILPVYDPEIPGQPRKTGGIAFYTSDTPAGAFQYVCEEMLPIGTGTDYHRDLSAFQDSDGSAYVISVHDQHAPNGNLMISKLTPDYLSVEKVVCEVHYPKHESPGMIKMKGKYWLFVSGHGAGAWGGSPTSYATATDLAGPWSEFREISLTPASRTSYDSQTDFLFLVQGSEDSFVLWGADRWSQRTHIGTGKNIWLPLQWDGDTPKLIWYDCWKLYAAKGTWTTESITK